MNNYLIALDIDGTITDREGKVSKKTYDILEEISKQKNYVVLCTARPRYYALNIAKNISELKYIVSSNGSEVYDINRKTVVYSKYLDKKTVYNTYFASLKYNIRIILVSDAIEYATKRIVNDNQELLTSENANDILDLNVKQIMVIDNNKKLVKSFKKYIQSKLNLLVADESTSEREYSWFTITNNSNNKGKAIENLANKLQIPSSRIIAIGNGDNDISMIDYAGLGVAVENSSNKLKAAANLIIGKSEDEGVSKFLMNWLKNQK